MRRRSTGSCCWLRPRVEDNHYHRHAGVWPDERKTAWLQWTASPPSVADLDRDGRNEVIGLPNVEREEPYETQAYAFMVLDGAYGGGARSARRHKGFNKLPLTRKPRRPRHRRLLPAERHPRPHRRGQPGDRRPEIVASVPDGSVYAVGPTGKRLWRYDYARLRHQRSDGNGIGVPAAPSIGDLDGDGRLEIVVSTFDHGSDVYRVPGSATNRLPWPTGRGNLLRNGAAGLR